MRLHRRRMNYWYTARTNEIFLDLDSRRALRRALSVLHVAVRRKRLRLASVWLYKTAQKNHFHMIVVLKTNYTAPRLAWSLWMGNDRLRAAYVLARMFDGNVMQGAGDLLVTKTPYHRKPDFKCQCSGKHKPESVTRECPALRHFLGASHSADYFARTGPMNPDRGKTRFRWGRIPLQQIRNWRANA